MNWWTAEYGLIGSLENPKIFGAGLLSSVGESQSCLTDKVKKLPLTVNCIETSYDITEQQPQLFVAKDFAELSAVLEQMSQQMSYKQGGAKGLQKALLAKTVNTVELDSGLQISGELETFLLSESSQVSFVKFKGPVQLSHLESEIQGHSVAHHSQGFSSPLGSIKGFAKSLSVCTLKDFESLGIISGKAVQLEFETGFRLAGQVETFCFKGDRCLIISFKNCTVTDTKKNTVHFKPEWGVFDLALGDKVVSVFGGPADRARFPITDDFVVRKVIPTKYSNTELVRHDDYQQIRSWRESQATNESLPDLLPKLVQKHLVTFPKDWLFYFEALELTKLKKMQHPIYEKLHQHLIQLSQSEKQYSDSIIQGLEILNS
jgi:phenylalanine-4-hydroxylase